MGRDAVPAARCGTLPENPLGTAHGPLPALRSPEMPCTDCGFQVVSPVMNRLESIGFNTLIASTALCFSAFAFGQSSRADIQTDTSSPSPRIQISESCPTTAKWIAQILSSGTHIRFVSCEPELGILIFQHVSSEPDPVLPSDVVDFVKKGKTVNISGMAFTLRSLVGTSLSFQDSPSKISMSSCAISLTVKFVSKNGRILESSGLAEKEVLDMLRKRYAEHALDY